jgi:hypothetical protein
MTSVSVREPIALSAEVKESASADVALSSAGGSPLSVASLADSLIVPGGFCGIGARDV